MNNLTVTEFKDIRVLTTQQLAEEYGTDNKTISYNFNHNKERYTEGKHYICLEGVEKIEFINRLENHDSLKNAKVLYLWTEKGCLLHAKSLGTDKAWEVYEILVDTYFKKSTDLLDNLSDEMKVLLSHDKKLQMVFKEIESTNKNIIDVDKDLQSFKMDMPILGLEETKITSAVKKKGVSCLGGKDSAAYQDKSLRGRVYTDIYGQLKRQFEVGTYKAIKRSQCDIAVEIINKYELPLKLGKEIKNCNAQMSIA